MSLSCKDMFEEQINFIGHPEKNENILKKSFIFQTQILRSLLGVKEYFSQQPKCFKVCRHAIVDLNDLVMKKRLITLTIPPLENRPTFKNSTKWSVDEALQALSKFCPMCYKIESTDEELNKHLETYHKNNFTCNKCPRRVMFTSKKNFEDHMMLFHSNYESISLQDPAPANFFDTAPEEIKNLAKKKRKLHPLFAIGLPTHEKKKLKKAEET